MTKTIERNQNIQNLKIIDNIYIYIYIYIYICDYTNSDVKTFKYQKRYTIKEEVIETIQKIYDYSKEKYNKKKKVHQPIKQ